MNEYQILYRHYENCFDRHGDNHKGVDWPDAKQAELRYQVMLGLIGRQPCTLLDLGCGLSHLYEFMSAAGEYEGVEYAGLDISEKFVTASKEKYPGNRYFHKDCLKEPLDLHFDYIVMNGVFTEKREMSHQAMYEFFTELVLKVYPFADRGLAFNVMSKQVDWERDDLFHLPLDDLAWFLHNNKMRNFVIRNDYGLYEYTVYVCREPRA